MSSMPLSALNTETEIYPLLTVAQIDRIRPFTRLRSVEKGEVFSGRCRGGVVSLAIGVHGD
jgi:hypothetical protein